MRRKKFIKTYTAAEIAFYKKAEAAAKIAYEKAGAATAGVAQGAYASAQLDYQAAVNGWVRNA